MKSYENLLKKKGLSTLYIENDLERYLKNSKTTILYVADPEDIKLKKRIHSLTKKLKITLKIIKNQGFLSELDEFEKTKHLRFETFYIHQRKTQDLLLDKEGKPLGGRWSMDRENRKKLPKSIKIPKLPRFKKTKAVTEALSYVKKKYPQNPGNSDGFNYPTTHADAKKALKNFLENRLVCFGDYEDAILQNESILFHSCLSPLLNVGLLTPDQIVTETLKHSKKHKIPFNSLEGFIRQVVGWREFVRGAYHTIGEKERKANFFKHKKKLPKSFYEATTGILPVDETIKKVHRHAYVHHIERLMILGNFFLLCEIDPNEIYRWFMELFIDAYDWVMVPNVYGMSQYADGGMMTTKPYFSGSNYILKMSDYPKGPWCKIWDALFWRFMIKHIAFFERQPRLSPLCLLAKKKKHDRELLKVAEAFLKKL